MRVSSELCLCFPQKDMYAMEDLHVAFQEDALVSSHPLSPSEEDLLTTSQIIAVFDSITYSKVQSRHFAPDAVFLFCLISAYYEC